MRSVKKILSNFSLITLFGLPVFETYQIVEDCPPECLRCHSVGCIKCPQLIMFSTRQCVDECPKGYFPQWSRLDDYMGQVCFNTGHIWGLSGEAFAILIGICLGAIFCIIIVIIGIIYARHKKKNAFISKFEDDSFERREFLKQLEVFRPHAYTFLDMLNDTRRQIRELYRQGDHVGIAAYRPVVSDLAKLLVLLNRSPEHIPEVPRDWDKLSAWAEKLLKRYKRMSDNSSQVAQLINFLQTPSVVSYNSRAEPQSQFTTLSTFKPDQNTTDSSLSLQDVAVQSFNSNFDDQLTGTLNPTWQFPNYSLVTMGNVNWNNSREYLNRNSWLDDDFFQLGFRPQDEITTEL